MNKRQRKKAMRKALILFWEHAAGVRMARKIMSTRRAAGPAIDEFSRHLGVRTADFERAAETFQRVIRKTPLNER